MPHKGIRPRGARGLALTVAVSTLALGWLITGAVKPVHAEFEIQEADVEKGEVQLQYRGAVHWGFPGDEKQDSAKEVGGALGEEEEGPLRQSHDFEVQWGITDRWLFATTLVVDQPLGENFEASAVEFELEYEAIERNGAGIGLSFDAQYGKATRGGEADEIEFGPIIEYATGKLLLTINPFFTTQVGENRQADGLGFDYGWRAEYDFAKHWGVGVEMFGQIEDLANAGPFNDQNHSIGPTLFYNLGSDDDHEEKSVDDEKVAGAPKTEFYLNVGVQFGLTDATSDAALKFQGELDF